MITLVKPSGKLTVKIKICGYIKFFKLYLNYYLYITYLGI